MTVTDILGLTLCTSNKKDEIYVQLDLGHNTIEKKSSAIVNSCVLGVGSMVLLARYRLVAPSTCTCTMVTCVQ